MHTCKIENFLKASLFWNKLEGKSVWHEYIMFQEAKYKKGNCPALISPPLQCLRKDDVRCGLDWDCKGKLKCCYTNCGGTACQSEYNWVIYTVIILLIFQYVTLIMFMINVLDCLRRAHFIIGFSHNHSSPLTVLQEHIVVRSLHTRN